MNKGSQCASGEIKGFLNSDDFLLGSDVLEKVAAICQEESVEACYTELVYLTLDKIRVPRHW
jgi:hypothetical protein